MSRPTKQHLQHWAVTKWKTGAPPSGPPPSFTKITGAALKLRRFAREVRRSLKSGNKHGWKVSPTKQPTPPLPTTQRGAR
eukprot:9620370-Alexandrium_andersonii.AAC.1